MFGRKSHLTEQIAKKENLLKDVNTALYALEKGKFSKSLDSAKVLSEVAEVRKIYNALSNSIGDGKSDISNGCVNVRKDIDALNKASTGNLMGKFEDCVIALIGDMQEIIDLENGIIDSIAKEPDDANKTQRILRKKLEELDGIQRDFEGNCSRVEQEIRTIERDKAELDEKLLSETNVRVKQGLFNQIKTTMQKIQVLNVKREQYSACGSLLDSVKTYARELICSGNISSAESDKAKVILNIGRLRDVLDDPNRLKPLLRTIENDLKKAVENTTVVDCELGKSFGESQAQYDEMNNYINAIAEKRFEKENISGSIADLDPTSIEKRN